MPRLFAAVVLPDAVKDSLLAVRPASIPGLRLVGRDEMHLTLHFLGEADQAKTEAAVRTLAGVRAGPFEVAVQGVRRFPADGEPRVLWAGVRPDPALSALHHTVGTALATAVGFRPEARPYTPHVTLAHLNAAPPPGWADEYLRQQATLSIPSVPIIRFALLSGVFTPEGPRYQVEAAFDLSGGGP
jgi:2'-5' RNA ligase